MVGLMLKHLSDFFAFNLMKQKEGKPNNTTHSYAFNVNGSTSNPINYMQRCRKTLVI